MTELGDKQDGISVLIRVLGLPQVVTTLSCAIGVAGDAGELTLSEKNESLLLPPVAFNDNGDSAGGDSGNSTVGGGVEGDGQVVDGGDVGDKVVGDDVPVPVFLASRGSDPLVLILLSQERSNSILFLMVSWTSR